MTSSTNSDRKIRVWDPWVRISHWLLAAAFFVAYFVVEDPLWLHVWAGYLIGALILIRIVWGVVGPKHARLSDFVPSPGRLATYLKDLVRGREARFLGHNPVGAVMIVVLLLALVGTVITGLMVYGAEEKAGPLGAWYAAGPTASVAPIAIARAGKEEEKRDKTPDRETEAEHEEAELLEELHEIFSNLTLFLVILHIGGVIFTSLRERQNLVWTMITGRKRA